ncbi:MAG: hypothetical protein ACLP7Q_08465 [Isosphaeraceae bacterium]
MDAQALSEWSSSLPEPLQEARIALDEIVQTIDPVRRSLEEAVADHPVKALVVSLTVGVVIGWLIKR